jgi:hypothetical protein
LVTPRWELVVGVPDPHDRNALLTCSIDEAADIRDDLVALVCAAHDACLHIHHEERGVRPVLECRHGASSGVPGG